MEMIAKMRKAGIIPVIKIPDEEKALPLADALAAGGLNVLEVTFRSDAAAGAIENIAKNRRDVVVGAGTVLSVDQLRRAADSGARFAVSPGFNEKVAGYALTHDIPFFPGVLTPTEAERALGFGLEVLKFFPAENFGGVKTLKSLSAPYANVHWIPTGGIDADNLAGYLRFEKVVACGASCMVGEALVAAENYAEITRLAKALCEIKRQARG